MSINESMVQEIIVYPYMGILIQTYMGIRISRLKDYGYLR